MKTISVILGLVLGAGAQVVEPWKIPCEEEMVQSNLEVSVEKHVFGELKDPTGAVFEGSKVILKKQVDQGKFVDYRVSVTDKNGHFDLKVLEPGKYRLLPSPNRGWKQPKKVQCGESPQCEIKLVLELNATDQPFAGCPVR